MKKICVYLGASFGKNIAYRDAVVKLANEIVDMDLTLVYGGSSLGMMGLLATTVKELGGKVIGIITTHLLKKEKPLEILDELHVVNSMQERKKMMQDISDFFIVMPGGLGTINEALETWNANKIGEIQKKIGFLNIDGYFDELFTFINSCRRNGFLSHEQGITPELHSNIHILLNKLVMTENLEAEENSPVLI